MLVSTALWMVIVFILMDLYFKFFHTPTLKEFVTTYFIDILAVLPLGWFISQISVPGRISEEFFTKGQQLVHVTADGEKVAVGEAQFLKRGLNSVPAWHGHILKLQRFLRLNRIIQFRIKNKKNKIKE